MSKFVYLKKRQAKDYYKKMIYAHIHDKITLRDSQVLECIERKNK